MNITDTLTKVGLPVSYNTFKEPVTVPFLVYIGAGQDRFFADDTIFKKTELYQVEYYFRIKSPETEQLIEETLLADGWIYEKSDDVPTEDENVILIYYNVWRK